MIAVDIDESKLALARQVGAKATVVAGPSAAAEVRELSGGLGAMVVLDCVGSAQTMGLAVAAARAGGAVRIIGLAGGTLPLASGALPFDCSLSMAFWGSVVELLEVLELARAGTIRAHTERFALDDVASAYATPSRRHDPGTSSHHAARIDLAFRRRFSTSLRLARARRLLRLRKGVLVAAQPRSLPPRVKRPG